MCAEQVAGKFYPLEIEQGEVPETKLSLENSKSQLPRPVQELVTLIFDIGKQLPSFPSPLGVNFS